jgi:Ca-activated chloride channel homolog
MFRFEYTEHLYALALIPILLLFFAFAWRARRRAVRRFGDTRLMSYLMPLVSTYRYYLKFGLLLLSLALLAIGWANPQYGTKLAKVTAKSVDVFIALDISQSMLAQDVPPSRLIRARRFAQDIVSSLRGERLGLILFAGSAYVQSPITSDFNAILLSLRSAHPNMIPDQGTSIGGAIKLAMESFEENNKNHKALIIISDGEEHEEDALLQAKTARENGLLIYTIGIGSPDGGLIPIEERGRESYKRSSSGEPVLSILNEEMLRALAQAGDGRYFNLASGSSQVLDALKESIGQIEKREMEQRVFSEYNSYFQWFVGLAILLLILEFLLPYRSSQRLTGKDLFEI